MQTLFEWLERPTYTLFFHFLLFKVRGKSDHWNSTLAAVTTGVMLSWRGGVAPMIISSAGMAALAFAGDMAMRGSHRPSSLFSGE